MEAREKNHTQEIAAAKAGISERSGREIEHGTWTDPTLKIRRWRTRLDPLEKVWESEIIPLLRQSPSLQPLTLLEYLQSKHAGMYPDKLLRTLQRRVKRWRALEGPHKEVMFSQIHVKGRQGLSDFTTLKEVTITISNKVFKHLLYHFRLAFSHWSYMMVVEGGESFTAFSEGLQNALERLGGAPQEHRTDSLSAAFKNLSASEQEDITHAYEAICLQYNMVATRNNRGVAHENGSVEAAHGHIKRRIEQALLLRGNNDFPSIEAYQDFIDSVVIQHNQRNALLLAEERTHLQALPVRRAIDYTQLSVVVSKTSTINVRRVTYSVPARLQGETLQVHVYDKRLLCYLGSSLVTELKRLHPKRGERARLVDYRHIIHSLVKKPQAFRHAALQNEILPNVDYHAIWQRMDSKMKPKEACKLIVGILHLAAQEDCEEALAKHVLALLDNDQMVSLSQLQCQFKKTTEKAPIVDVKPASLEDYNQHIPKPEECSHV